MNLSTVNSDVSLRQQLLQLLYDYGTADFSIEVSEITLLTSNDEVLGHCIGRIEVALDSRLSLRVSNPDFSPKEIMSRMGSRTFEFIPSAMKLRAEGVTSDGIGFKTSPLDITLISIFPGHHVDRK